MSRLIRLYPPRWRARYEAEFEATLDELRPSLMDRLDIVRGALRAWLDPRYGYRMRRSSIWIGLLTAVAFLLAPNVGAIRDTPVGAQAQYRVYLDWGIGPYGTHPPVTPILDLTIQNRGSRIDHLVLAFTFHHTLRPGWHVASLITGSSTTYFHPKRVAIPGADNAWNLSTVRHGTFVRFMTPLHSVRAGCTYLIIHVYAVVGHPSQRVPVEGGATGGACGLSG